MRKIVGRPSNYMNSIKYSASWNVVKSTIRRQRNYTCEVCGLSSTDLDVHHLTYYVNGHSILGNELNHTDKLKLVCRTCHKQIHDDYKNPFNPKNYGKQ